MTRLKREYLKRQKIAGFILFLIAIFTTLFVEGTIGLVGMMLGLYLIFTKMVIFDRNEYLEDLKEMNRQRRLK